MAANLAAMFAKHNSAQNWCWSSRSAPDSPNSPLVHSNSESYCLNSTKNKYNNLLSLETRYWLPYIGWWASFPWNEIKSGDLTESHHSRAEVTDTETPGLTEMEVRPGGVPAVIDFLHLSLPSSHWDWLTPDSRLQAHRHAGVSVKGLESTQSQLNVVVHSEGRDPMFVVLDHPSPLNLSPRVRWCLRRVFVTWVMVHIYIYTSVFTARVNIDLPEINLRRGRLLLPFKDLNNNILLANLTSRTM